MGEIVGRLKGVVDSERRKWGSNGRPGNISEYKAGCFQIQSSLASRSSDLPSIMTSKTQLDIFVRIVQSCM